MKRCGFGPLLALCFFITNVDAYSSRRGGFFVDIGGLAGCFKGKEKHDCMDVGFVGTTDDVFKKPTSTETTTTTTVLHQHTEDCISTAKTKTKLSFGGKFGFFVSLDEHYAIGIEGFSEWHDVQYPDGFASFKCSVDKCNKQLSRTQYSYKDGKLEAGGPTTNGLCSDLAPSERIYESPLKTLRHHQYGALLSMKFYTSGDESFVKIGGGVGQLIMKNPVGVAHEGKGGDPGNKESDLHKYEIKKITCRKGLAWGAEIATRITRSVYLGVSYIGQRNLSKDKLDTYTNNKVSLSLSMDLGR